MAPLNRHRRTARRWRFVLYAVVLSVIAAHAQTEPQLGGGSAFAGFQALSDTTARMADSIAYAADEITWEVEGSTITLLGNARVDYAGMTLTAHRIRFLTDDDLVIAEGHADPEYPDSIIGLPTFSDGAESFQGHRLSYNLRTRAGVVEGGYSESPEGIYQGERVKRTGEKQLDVSEGVYTTCDKEHAHYKFRASKMRVLVGDKVIVRPVVLEIADVPVFWFPFGVFFINQDRRSGFLSPRVGENAYAGRYMRGFGYYIAPNDYVGFQGVLNIDERNGYDWGAVADYSLRYHLSGGISANYSRRWGTFGQRVWRFNARHRQELSPRSSLTANINYSSTETPTLTASSTPAEDLRQTYNSTLGYQKSWESGYSFRTEFWRSQNLQNRQLDQRTPTVSISSGTQYFFPEPERRGPRARARRSEPEWWQRLTYSWGFTGTNTGYQGPTDMSIFDTWLIEEVEGDSVVTYRLTLSRGYSASYPEDDGTYRVEVEDGALLRQGRIQKLSDTELVLISYDTDLDDGRAVMSADARTLDALIPGIAGQTTWSRRSEPNQFTQTTSQNARLGLPLPTPRWLNVTPSLNWQAAWTSDPDDDPDSYSYHSTKQTASAGVSSNATFYGLFPVGVGPLSAIRHVVTPSVGARLQLDRYTRDGRYIFGGDLVRADTSRIVDFGLRNVFQAKVLWDGEEKRFDNLLTLSTGISYNHDADRRRWSNISTTVQLQPAENVSSRVSFVHQLYDDDDTLRWRDPLLNSVSISTSVRIAGAGSTPDDAGDEGYNSQRTEQADSPGSCRAEVFPRRERAHRGRAGVAAQSQTQLQLAPRTQHVTAASRTGPPA